eukprot:5487139-Amphidinium_carterae.1
MGGLSTAVRQLSLQRFLLAKEGMRNKSVHPLFHIMTILSLIEELPKQQARAEFAIFAIPNRYKPFEILSNNDYDNDNDTDRQTDRQAASQPASQPDRQTDRQTDSTQQARNRIRQASMQTTKKVLFWNGSVRVASVTLPQVNNKATTPSSKPHVQDLSPSK